MTRYSRFLSLALAFVGFACSNDPTAPKVRSVSTVKFDVITDSAGDTLSKNANGVYTDTVGRSRFVTVDLTVAPNDSVTFKSGNRQVAQFAGTGNVETVKIAWQLDKNQPGIQTFTAILISNAGSSDTVADSVDAQLDSLVTIPDTSSAPRHVWVYGTIPENHHLAGMTDSVMIGTAVDKWGNVSLPIVTASSKVSVNSGGGLFVTDADSETVSYTIPHTNVAGQFTVVATVNYFELFPVPNATSGFAAWTLTDSCGNSTQIYVTYPADSTGTETFGWGGAGTTILSLDVQTADSFHVEGHGWVAVQNTMVLPSTYFDLSSDFLPGAVKMCGGSSLTLTHN